MLWIYIVKRNRKIHGMGPLSILTLRLVESHVFVNSILRVVYCCIKINLLVNLRYASVDIHIEYIDDLPSK